MTDEIYATLYIRGSSIDSSEISHALGIPSESVLNRTIIDSIGIEKQRDKRWSIRSGIDHHRTIDDHINALIERMSGHERSIIKLCARLGIHPNIHLSVYSEKIGYSMRISERIIRKLSEMSIDLSVDVYLSQNNTDE